MVPIFKPGGGGGGGGGGGATHARQIIGLVNEATHSGHENLDLR